MNQRKRKAQNGVDGLLNGVENGDWSVKKKSAVKMGLPNRWLYCPPMGKVVAERFLPMKTPMSTIYDEQIEPKYQFHPQDVFKRQIIGSKAGAKIGLWMDFTKTDRYYDRKEVEKNGCAYIKMPLEGHGQTPTEEETTEFISAAKKFFRDHPNDVMAMHCTHGFNRTGFLIVSFLVEEVEYAVDMAVEEFAKARPQGIYKQDYLNELSKRFGDEEDIIPAPNRPLWEHGPVTDEDYYNGVMANEQQEQSNLGMPDTSDGPSTSNGVNRTRKGIPQFMDGAVPGVSFVESADERKYLQQKTRAYCGFKGNQFPGSQPVSMERSPDNDNLKLLAKNRYMVSWKADGVRYLVLIEGESQVYAFDRDNNVFIIPNVTFLHRKLGRHLTNTLVDAEMIIEKVKDEKTGKINEIPRLLIYDIIAFEDKNVGKECFTTRTQIITVELIEPRRKAMMEGKIIRENEPMSVRRKDFCFLLATHKYFDQKFMCNLGHQIDGLIFQPVDEPYTAGRFDKLLKWKPPEQCTIDFKLQIQTIERPGMLKERKGLLYVLHTDVPLGEIKVTRDLMKYEGKIIECHFNPKTKYWEFMRERTDKSFPNAYTTAKSVCNTIRYPITKEILLHYIDQHGRKMDDPQKHPPPETGYWEFMRERTDKSFPNAYTTAISVWNTICYPITKEILLQEIAEHGRKMDDHKQHPPVQQQC